MTCNFFSPHKLQNVWPCLIILSPFPLLHLSGNFPSSLLFCLKDFSIKRETRKRDFTSSLQAYVKEQSFMLNHLNLFSCENSKLGSYPDQSASSWNADILCNLLTFRPGESLSFSVVGFCGGGGGRGCVWGERIREATKAGPAISIAILFIVFPHLFPPY